MIVGVTPSTEIAVWKTPAVYMEIYCLTLGCVLKMYGFCRSFAAGEEQFKFFFKFSFLSFTLNALPYPVFQIADCSSASSNLLLVPSSLFSISIIVFLSCDYFFFIFSISLLNFSLSTSTLCPVQWVSLWPLLWTLYQVDCLSPFHWYFFLCFVLFFYLYYSPLTPHFVWVSVFPPFFR